MAVQVVHCLKKRGAALIGKLVLAVHKEHSVPRAIVRSREIVCSLESPGSTVDRKARTK